MGNRLRCTATRPSPSIRSSCRSGSCCPTLGVPGWAFVGESGYCLSQEWGRGPGRVARPDFWGLLDRMHAGRRTCNLVHGVGAGQGFI